MHRCLKIPSVLVFICEAFAQVASGHANLVANENTATLAALARTCRSFHPHALDVLWRTQTTLIPLIRCFPLDAWEQHGPSFGDVRFRRPLVRQDWDRVNLYACRVRDLGFDWPIQWVPAPLAIWQVLELSRPLDVPLLPNLHYLSWEVHDKIFPYIRMLLGPKLSHLRIQLANNTETHRLSIMPLLNSLCPNLKCVGFFPEERSVIAKNIISSTIMQWNSLESLDVESLTSLAMDHIASLPKLRHLRLRGYKYPFHPHLSGRTVATFPALQSLCLAGPDDMSDCAPFIATINPSQLREVMIMLPGHTTPNLWKCICMALGPSRNTLTKLDISELPEPIHRGWTVDWDCLKALTVLHGLKKVVLEPVGGLDLDDGQFGKLVSAWPMLEHLDLGSLEVWLRPSRITLAGLAPLVEKCPNLGHLGLSVNARERPTWVPRMPTPSDSRLTTISVGFSVIQDPVGVAQLLHGLFPRLSVVEPELSPLGLREALVQIVNYSAELWNAVSQVLRLMRDCPPIAAEQHSTSSNSDT